MSVESGLSEESEGGLHFFEEEATEVFWGGFVDEREDGKGVVLEGAHGTFSGVLLVYVRGYELVSDLPVLLDDTLVLGADFVIDNLEVELVALRSEAVHYGVVGCNEILFFLGIERSNKDGVGFTMVGGQDVLITSVRSNGEVTRVFHVEL